MDYVASFKVEHGSDILQYGVKGMKWGVRNNNRITSSRGSKAKPTLARKKEEKNLAKAKEIDRLVNLRDKVESGKSTVSVGGKKLSTDQALKKIDRNIDKLSKRNEVVAKQTRILGEKPVAASKTAQAQKPVDRSNESSIQRYNRLKAEVAKKGANSLEDEDLKFLNTRREALAKANAAYHTKDSTLQKLVRAAIEATMDKQLKSATDRLGDMHLKPRLNKLVDKTQRLTPLPTPTPTP